MDPNGNFNRENDDERTGFENYTYIYTHRHPIFRQNNFFSADVKLTRFWKEGLKKLKRRLNQLKRGLTQQKRGSKWI
jgi:hypothetical protein